MKSVERDANHNETIPEDICKAPNFKPEKNFQIPARLALFAIPRDEPGFPRESGICRDRDPGRGLTS